MIFVVIRNSKFAYLYIYIFIYLSRLYSDDIYIYIVLMYLVFFDILLGETCFCRYLHSTSQAPKSAAAVHADVFHGT